MERFPAAFRLEIGQARLHSCAFTSCAQSGWLCFPLHAGTCPALASQLLTGIFQVDLSSNHFEGHIPDLTNLISAEVVSTCGNRFPGDLSSLTWSGGTFSVHRITLRRCRESGLTCEAGYSCDEDSLSTRAHICPAGQYSAGGAPKCTPCPPGRFGATAGLTSSNCTGPCDAGEAVEGRHYPLGSCAS